ncbi:hypothetical protein BIY29_03150 [Brenneria alni]|uniref:Uncharacterized protein n=1 Tax=Brenneria alni TaxID=71656 RepID=A0A421DSD4_9GAMM|nr:hypothetical protein [Brenneria alni]RLM27233.1 hypothetical protein BIY29_03150 [Brenneria alni]
MSDEMKKSFEYTKPFTANKGEEYFMRFIPWVMRIMTILFVLVSLSLWFEYDWPFFININDISFLMVFFLSLFYFIFLSIDFFRMCRLKLDDRKYVGESIDRLTSVSDIILFKMKKIEEIGVGYSQRLNRSIIVMSSIFCSGGAVFVFKEIGGIDFSLLWNDSRCFVIASLFFLSITLVYLMSSARIRMVRYTISLIDAALEIKEKGKGDHTR